MRSLRILYESTGTFELSRFPDLSVVSLTELRLTIEHSRRRKSISLDWILQTVAFEKAHFKCPKVQKTMILIENQQKPTVLSSRSPSGGTRRALGRSRDPVRTPPRAPPRPRRALRAPLGPSGGPRRDPGPLPGPRTRPRTRPRAPPGPPPGPRTRPRALPGPLRGPPGALQGPGTPKRAHFGGPPGQLGHIGKSEVPL